MSPDRSNAIDHVVLLLFENRSFDNMLGRLYGPGDGKRFEGWWARTSEPAAGHPHVAQSRGALLVL